MGPSRHGATVLGNPDSSGRDSLRAPIPQRT
jgi:hypothetical protein